MKNLKLVVLLLVFSPVMMAQAPQSDQLLSMEQAREILFTSASVNLNNSVTDLTKHSAEMNLQNYLQQKGIYSNYSTEDSPVPIDVISGDQFLDAGVVSISQLNNIGFGTFGNKNDGNDNGNTGTSNIHLHGGANIIRGLGVRGLVQINNQTYKPEQGDDKYKDRLGLVGLEVVKPLLLGNQAVNIYGGFSTGANKQIQEVSGNEFEFIEDLFIYGAGAELPISLGGSAAYFTPMISYIFENGDYDNGEYDYNSLQIRGGMYSFFTCAMFDPCGKDGLALGDGHYKAGSSCLGSDAGFNLEIGKETDKYSYGGYSSGESKSNNMHTGLQFDYGHYIIDGLAVRGIVNYAGETVKDDEDSDIKETWTQFMGGLGVNYNLPLEGKLQHLFVKGDFMVGTDKDKDEDGVNTTEVTHDLTNITFGAGYNLFFVNGVAFTPTIGYSASNWKNGSDQDTNGLFINIGITNYFNLF